ncbi:glycosyltransferase [Candidatus Dojkabacteria bacterium]|nr:glycosyltransferase [Candidatus Dojkabacteria bacterium]
MSNKKECPTNYSVTAIIPCYNEAKYIERIIADVRSSGLFSQIIVVNDGSTDNTESILENTQNIQVIKLKENQGKSFAVSKGLEGVTSRYVCLLDADYLKYSRKDLKNLVTPIVSKNYDISIRRAASPFFTFISGCRCYKTEDLVPLRSGLKNLQCYGLEQFLNSNFRKKKKKFVTFHNSKHVERYHRYPLGKAITSYLKIAWQVIAQTLRPPEKY